MDIENWRFPARAGTFQAAALAGLLWTGLAAIAPAQEAPRCLTLAGALALAEARGFDFLLADAALHGTAP